MPKAILHGLALAQFRSSATALARRGSRISTFLWWFMLLSSLAIVVYATRIFLAAPSDEHFFGYLLSFLFACILPEAWGRFRRALGSFPKIASTGAEPAPLARSLPLIGSRARLGRRLRHGLVSEQGLATSLGFGILAVLWFLTALEAYRTVRRGNIEAHRRWMIRNFALTLAAVIPRNRCRACGSPSIGPSRVPTSTVSWLCWVPNLLIAEWMVRRRKPPSPSRSYR